MIEAQRPPLEELPPFYHGYVQRMGQAQDLFSALDATTRDVIATFATVDEERSLYRYAPGKWSLKELVQHLSDCERILTYRALCFARGDRNPLPGFDEDAYAAASGADERSWTSLTSEWKGVRSSTLDLFRSFSPSMLLNSGTANNGLVTVRALGWIVAGHTAHHLSIIHERYR
jgi:hypothetical protein